jgi:hypothetical protein
MSSFNERFLATQRRHNVMSKIVGVVIALMFVVMISVIGFIAYVTASGQTRLARWYDSLARAI